MAAPVAKGSLVDIHRVMLPAGERAPLIPEDTQRVALTYMYNDSFNVTESDGDLNEFEFADHFYNRGAERESISASLYSDWTPNFSTELRIAQTDVDFLQAPRAGPPGNSS